MYMVSEKKMDGYIWKSEQGTYTFSDDVMFYLYDLPEKEIKKYKLKGYVCDDQRIKAFVIFSYEKSKMVIDKDVEDMLLSDFKLALSFAVNLFDKMPAVYPTAIDKNLVAMLEEQRYSHPFIGKLIDKIEQELK